MDFLLLFWPSLTPPLRSYFRPFTRVLSEIRPGVTRKVRKTADYTDITDGFPRWRLTQTPYNLMLDSTRRITQPRDALPLYSCYPCNPLLNSFDGHRRFLRSGGRRATDIPDLEIPGKPFQLG
jgi:hypothetical protein